MDISHELRGLLASLTSYLQRTHQVAEFHIIGSFAMELKGFKRPTYTNDIDLLKDPEKDDVSEEINRLGEQVKNEMWMNLNASDIPLPDGFEERTERVEYNENIVFVIPSKKDMILLKVAAAIDRVKDDRKDIDDLKLLAPSKEDVEEGTAFYRKTRMSEIRGTEFEGDSRERIELMRRLLGF